jgi:hypothetical protein
MSSKDAGIVLGNRVPMDPERVAVAKPCHKVSVVNEKTWC